MRTLIERVLISLALLGLTSCATHRGDGPPPFNVDVSHIPNAVPKAEPLAKYGNMTSYKVFGKRYFIMKNSKSFEQVGIASWYGTKFHKQRTSSGEKYDMLGMTAAHKTLPLPTYVEVTNLQNHKQIIVKVNDRGPFSDNRIIDLSYVAAKKLGMLGHGTAKVRVRALDPHTYHAKQTVTPTTTIHDHAGFYIQAGAFSQRANALKLQNRLSSMLSTPIHIAAPRANSKLYRVQIGPINDAKAAARISTQLKSLGIQPKRVQGV